MIRLARPADESAIRACAEAAYAPYVPLIGRKPAPMLADFAGQIAAGQVHVAEAEGTFQGFVVFHPEGGAMLLENVAVRPEAAGRGIGKALVAICEAEARAQGFPSVRLYTNEKMAANLSIYPRFGYVETARRTEDGFNRVYFEKML